MGRSTVPIRNGRGRLSLIGLPRFETEDTGWRPSVELSEGLERTISWWHGRLAAGLVRRQKEFIT